MVFWKLTPMEVSGTTNGYRRQHEYLSQVTRIVIVGTTNTCQRYHECLSEVTPNALTGNTNHCRSCKKYTGSYQVFISRFQGRFRWFDKGLWLYPTDVVKENVISSSNHTST